MTNQDPKHKVEISQDNGNTFTDVSDYIVGDSAFTKNAFNQISEGTLQLDIDSPITPQVYDNIRISLGYGTADTIKFYGLIGPVEEPQNSYTVPFFSYSKLTTMRTYTGVHRDDAGTGNAVDIVKSIIVKKLTELSYDDTSIPSSSISLVRYAVQNKFINEIFDYIAELLGRVWWVDDNKKLWMIEREFSDSGITITYGTDIIGELTIIRDISRWGNYIIIDGDAKLTGYTQTFTHDGITSEYIVDLTPHDVTVTATGTTFRGSFVGAYDEDYADYKVDCMERSVTFQSGDFLTSGSTLTVDFHYMSRVHEELLDGPSVRKYGVVVKKLGPQGIQSQTEAKLMGHNYLDLYAYPLSVYVCKIPGTNDFNVGEQITLVHNEKNINMLVNVLEITYNFGVGGWTMDLILNTMPYGFPDLYKDLVLKVKQLEELDRISDEYIIQYHMEGTTLNVVITGSTCHTQPIMDSMVWNHPSGGNSNWDLASWGDRRGSESLIAQWV